MTKIHMDRFGSMRQKTEHHEKVMLEDGLHFVCQWIKCPHNRKGICKCIILEDCIHVIYCFCG